MVQFDDLKQFLSLYGITPELDKPITQQELELLVSMARLHGDGFAAVVMDCFDPDGANVDKDQDDYLYWFGPLTWNDLLDSI